MILLLTRMGSHLYGNNHEDSDKDFYCVTSTPHPSRIHKKTKVVKHMAYRYDLTEMDFGTFAKFSYDGIPQALEAMYAPQSAVLIDNLSEYRRSFHGSLPAMRDNYRRVIANHCTLEHTPKQRFHALRLALNFRQAQESNGRFNPRLDQATIEHYRELSKPENFEGYRATLNIINIT